MVALWAIGLGGLAGEQRHGDKSCRAGQPDGTGMPDMVRFLGRFHPTLLHLPIGVFALILVQEIGAMFSRRTRAKGNAGVFPMFFGAVSAVLAVIAGFLLYHGGGYEDNELAERHLWGGLGFAVAAIIAFIAKVWTVATAASPVVFRVLLFGSVGVMGFASHDGASMTHGSDYLTRYAPDSIRKILGLEPKPKPAPVKPLEAQLVYADIVAPILESRCVQCHKEGNSKGRFRMDTYELLLKGGKEGPGIEPGSAADSNIIVRMELPLDDDEHMPPEGKPQLEAHEIEIIRWWLDQDGTPEKTAGQLALTDSVREAIARIVPAAGTAGGADEADSPLDATAGPDARLVAAMAEISKDFPGALSFESKNSTNLTFTAVSMRGVLDDDAFAKLAPLLPNLVTLDLTATRITDRSVAALAPAGNLRLIRLAETDITDAAAESLAKLASLESVNLYGTKITDAGALKLAELPNLKRLYLWQTGVTGEAISALKEKLPDCEIITGT
jgi:uncharacterized membrane protein